MPRARQIKYGFFLNEKLAELPPLCRLLFEGLWLLADREGKLEDRPKKIHAQILPFDNDADIDAYIDALQDASFLRRYKIDDASFIKILNFNEHQNPHQNETESIIPNPVTQDSGASTVQEPDKHSTNPASMLVTSMLIIKKETKAKKKELRTKFEQLYETYPIHKDRQRALSAFEKLKPDDQLLTTMLNAIKNQKLEKETKTAANEFCAEWKYLAAWLNGKCWTDEIDVAAIEKEKRKKSPYTTCRRCGKEILKNSGSAWCNPCLAILYPKETWKPAPTKGVAHG